MVGIAGLEQPMPHAPAAPVCGARLL